MDILGKRIKGLRIEKNISQQQLAAVCNTTQDTVSLWELNKRNPDAETIVLLCKFFEVPSDYLLGLENEDGSKNY